MAGAETAGGKEQLTLEEQALAVVDAVREAILSRAINAGDVVAGRDAAVDLLEKRSGRDAALTGMHTTTLPGLSETDGGVRLDIEKVAERFGNEHTGDPNVILFGASAVMAVMSSAAE